MACALQPVWMQSWSASSSESGRAVKSYDNNVRFPEIHLDYPGWVRRKVDWLRPFAGDRDRIRVAIDVARENVLQGSGGPFGAAIFEEESGRLVAIGINRVVPLNNSVLHAEVFGFMMAQATLGSFTLAAEGMPAHTLYHVSRRRALERGAARRVVGTARGCKARELRRRPSVPGVLRVPARARDVIRRWGAA